jgi:hypothetical protein
VARSGRSRCSSSVIHVDDFSVQGSGLVWSAGLLVILARTWLVLDDLSSRGRTRSTGVPPVRYAHETNCPCDEDVTRRATATDSFGCLMYARARGCPWDKGLVVGRREKRALFALGTLWISC